MVLPLFECPPAAGQGAIVAEAKPDNKDAADMLERIKNEPLTKSMLQERVYAQKYGYGCSQQFGVFHLDTATTSFTYSSGMDENNQSFTEWDFDIALDVTNKQLFASTDYMKDFFSYRFLEMNIPDVAGKAVFISSHKAIHSNQLANNIAQKRVWAAGTRTWYELAKKGIWVEGCADGLGLEFLQKTMESPLINISKADLHIITNGASLQHWIDDGWNAAASYELIPTPSKEIEQAMGKADLIFWTSFQQYQLYKAYLKVNVRHLCPAGKTAKLLQQQGLAPVIFPTIKAFNTWRAKHITATNGG